MGSAVRVCGRDPGSVTRGRRRERVELVARGAGGLILGIDRMRVGALTRSETYRQRAAHYARQALEAHAKRRGMYAELAKAWRELAEQAEESSDRETPSPGRTTRQTR